VAAGNAAGKINIAYEESADKREAQPVGTVSNLS
jgi:hypothetical protein